MITSPAFTVRSPICVSRVTKRTTPCTGAS